MEFDITDIDKKILIKALYVYSEAIGLGILENSERELNNENVIGLTDEECDEILADFGYNYTRDKTFEILDYYKGKPMKIYFDVKKNGRILLDTEDYDARNGLYRALECLMDTFLLEEIKITKKGFPTYMLDMAQKNRYREKEEIKKFKKILQETILEQNKYGKYFSINTETNDYKPEIFMKLN